MEKDIKGYRKERMLSHQQGERTPVLNEEWEQIFLKEPEEEPTTHIEMDEHGYIIDVVDEEAESMTLFDPNDEREYTDQP